MFPINVPNVLTVLRILLVPVLVVALLDETPNGDLLAAIVFCVASLTDLLDGWLARRLNQTSRLGAFLDPVADKLMVGVALVLLVQEDPRILLALPAAVIIGREITVSALREWMAELGARSRVAVSIFGKFKTIAQMIAILVLIYRERIFGLPVYEAGLVLLYAAALLTLVSMVQYLWSAWPKLTEKERKQ